jgi:hypothetical protein
MKTAELVMAATLSVAVCVKPMPTAAQTEPPTPVASLSLEELVDFYEVALGAVYRRLGHEEITPDALTIPPRMTQVPREHVPPEYAHLPISEAFQVLVERWDLPQSERPGRLSLRGMSRIFLTSDGVYVVTYTLTDPRVIRPPHIVLTVRLERTPDGAWRVVDRASGGAPSGEPEVAAMSERQYARYARYGRQDVDGFREHFHEGILVYLPLTGSSASGFGAGGSPDQYLLGDDGGSRRDCARGLARPGGKGRTGAHHGGDTLSGRG